MRRGGAFPGGVSDPQGGGKLGFAELRGAGSVNAVQAPVSVRRIGDKGESSFCFSGYLDNKPCTFRIDTGSDVSLLSRRFVSFSSQEKTRVWERLKYPPAKTSRCSFEGMRWFR